MNEESQLLPFRWLAEGHGDHWLEQLQATTDPVATWVPRLRRELNVWQTHAVIQQAELRQRAEKKFLFANRMLFDPQLLEQATDQWLADYKATRMESSSSCVDLCCGLGGDLLGLGLRMPTTAVDLNPTSILLAEFNWNAAVSSHERSGAGQTAIPKRVEFAQADAGQWTVGAADYWHIDPDRRHAGQRTTHAEIFSPTLEQLDQFVRAGQGGGVKLAPATPPPASWDSVEWEWLGRDRQCRQLVAWHGATARHPGSHVATLIGAATDAPHRHLVLGQHVGSPDQPCQRAERLGTYIYDTASTVRAARLTGSLANQWQLCAVGAGEAYLTGDALVADWLITPFEVESVQPLDRRRLKQHFACHGVGTLEIKTRGVDISPEALRRELKLKGENKRVLFIYRGPERVQTCIACRIRPGISLLPDPDPC